MFELVDILLLLLYFHLCICSFDAFSGKSAMSKFMRMKEKIFSSYGKSKLLTWSVYYYYYNTSVFGQKIKISISANSAMYTLMLLLTCQWMCIIVITQIHNIIRHYSLDAFRVCTSLEILSEKRTEELFSNYRTSVGKTQWFSIHSAMCNGLIEGSVSTELSVCKEVLLVRL